jgi:hypothetical protein
MNWLLVFHRDYIRILILLDQIPNSPSRSPDPNHQPRAHRTTHAIKSIKVKDIRKNKNKREGTWNRPAKEKRRRERERSQTTTKRTTPQAPQISD